MSKELIALATAIPKQDLVYILNVFIKTKIECKIDNIFIIYIFS